MVSQREAMVCPRPRRLERVGGFCDSGMDLLDVILVKDATSPPYFCGSPPIRSTNPLALDARFADAAAHFNSSAAPPAHYVAPAPPSSGSCTGCGPSPAAVRIEGFDCLGVDRRRGSRGIAAVA